METIIDNKSTQTSQSQSELSPDQVIDLLKEGNKRFTRKEMHDRDLMEQVKQTGGGQYPMAAILGCIDSRVPAEMVFDQGIGDIFNIRIAGNFANEDILGSMEFACAVAGSKAIVVLGHTHCGAVKGACDHVKLGNLTAMLENLKPAVDAVQDIAGERTSKNPDFVHSVATANVQQTVEAIRKLSRILRELEEQGKIAIVGAMYDVETGEVTFY